jgi:hypothetical protein
MILIKSEDMMGYGFISDRGKEMNRDCFLKTFLEAWRNITEDAILHSHRRENLISHKFLEYWAMRYQDNIKPYLRL